jgi:hypothetical protein
MTVLKARPQDVDIDLHRTAIIVAHAERLCKRESRPVAKGRDTELDSAVRNSTHGVIPTTFAPDEPWQSCLGRIDCREPAVGLSRRHRTTIRQPRRPQEVTR